MEINNLCATNIENLCKGCLAEKGGADVCRACGWPEGVSAGSPLTLPPGTVLNDQYLIGRVLGHGGFGITYLGRDLYLNTRVAIKEFLPRELATREPGTLRVTAYNSEVQGYFAHGLSAFIEEARTLAQFQDHPNVVKMLNFFYANNTGYLVMSYLDGLTFKDYLNQQGGKVPFETARSILMPVMDALREVHRAGMLHRDVSPDNIYLTYSRQVKVLDFGAARYAVGERSQSLSVILKAGYAPVEQYGSRGHQGPWTDVYALGATFYRAVTGQVPPSAPDRLAGAELQSPSRLGERVPAKAESALMKALAVKAEHRFQDVVTFQASITENIPGPDPGPEPPLEYAGFGRRLLAFIIDFVILQLSCGFFLFEMGGIRMVRDLLGGAVSDPDFQGTIFGVLVAWLYAALLESSARQGTLGKQLLGLAVTDSQGQRLSFGRASLRHFSKIVSGLIFGLGFLLAALTAKKQALHDIIADCLVVRRRKQEPLGASVKQ